MGRSIWKLEQHRSGKRRVAQDFSSIPIRGDCVEKRTTSRLCEISAFYLMAI